MIAVACDICAQRYDLPDSADGRSHRCKECGARFEVCDENAPVEPTEAGDEPEESTWVGVWRWGRAIAAGLMILLACGWMISLVFRDPWNRPALAWKESSPSGSRRSSSTPTWTPPRSNSAANSTRSTPPPTWPSATATTPSPAASPAIPNPQTAGASPPAVIPQTPVPSAIPQTPSPIPGNTTPSADPLAEAKRRLDERLERARQRAQGNSAFPPNFPPNFPTGRPNGGANPGLPPMGGPPGTIPGPNPAIPGQPGRRPGFP